MSSRRRLLRVLGFVAALGVLMGLTTEAASAKKLSAKQKAAIRASLKKQAKKNPGAVFKRSFLKKASLVNFTLPATIRVREKLGPGGTNLSTNAPGGLNRATIDLGASLGTRTIGLGGALPAQIRFHDSFEGGALGNVDLDLLPSTAPGMGLTTTSVPLLTNTDVTGAGYGSGGCVGWSSGIDPLGEAPGVDDPASLSGANNNPGDGTVGEGPYGLGGGNPGDVVLRTGSLNLDIASPGTFQLGGLDTSQEITIGRSGGQANLFGNIPGKSTQIDVTASLSTTINSLLRQVDSLSSGSGASLFNCRQAWTGGIQNVLSGVRLNGSLKISPAILADGKLRIAKASLSSAAPAQVALAACLFPNTAYAADDPAFNPANPPSAANSPIDSSAAPKPAPAAACNSAPHPVLGALGVTPLAAPGAGYTTSDDGSRAIVSGDLTVNNLTAEVLIGGNQL